MTTQAEERAKGVDLPAWWLEKVREIVDERKDTTGENLTQLGKLLAEAIGKAEPWDHSSVSRFLRNKNTTVPLAEAFAELFGIPRPFYVARSLDEAFSLQQVSRRYDSKQLTPDQQHRLAVVDQFMTSAEDETRDQTAGVRSRDEGADRGRRSGRAARRRPPSS